MDDITSRLSDFHIEFGGSNGLALNGLGTADRVIAHATGSNDWGCSVPTNFSPTLTLTNSICEGSEALVSSVSGIWNLTLRNDLLYSPGDALTVIDTAQMYTVNVSNTILHSTGGKDIRADGPGAVNITADHSNYATVTNTSAGNVTSAGSGTNQTAAPQFVNAGADDFRQAASSPTIGAGTDDPANGLVDLSDLPRKIGVHTDIGPYEAVLAPSLSVLAAAGISTGGATVNSSINPNAAATTYRVDYGPSPTYGASSAGQLQGDTSAHAIAVALSGLKPATTYHYRFVATNSAGTTTGADQTFTTLAPPVASPAVSGLKQSARKWREGKSQPQISRKRRPGIGTTFRFTLNDAAKVRFAFRRVVRGRRLGHRCVAPRRGNAHKPGCRRTLGAGALTFTGHAGSNAVRFQGRLSRKRKLRLGSYKLVVTATNAAGHSAARSISFKIVH
jgi:hypothetical protein